MIVLKQQKLFMRNIFLREVFRLLETESLFNVEETIAKELILSEKYPWKCIPQIHEFIIKLGNSLDKEKYEQREGFIWIAKSAKIAPTSCIIGPAIIDENAQIRHSAYIRENVIVGKNTVVGNSTELKNCILFNECQVPHFNYVGDSILGYRTHMGAGSITSNIKSNKENIIIKYRRFKKMDRNKYAKNRGFFR